MGYPSLALRNLLLYNFPKQKRAVTPIRLVLQLPVHISYIQVFIGLVQAVHTVQTEFLVQAVLLSILSKLPVKAVLPFKLHKAQGIVGRHLVGGGLLGYADI